MRVDCASLLRVLCSGAGESHALLSFFLFKFNFRRIILGVCYSLLCFPLHHQPMVCIPCHGWAMDVSFVTCAFIYMVTKKACFSLCPSESPMSSFPLPTGDRCSGFPSMQESCVVQSRRLGSFHNVLLGIWLLDSLCKRVTYVILTCFISSNSFLFPLSPFIGTCLIIRFS